MSAINLKQYNLQVHSTTITGFYDLGQEMTNQFKLFYQVFFTQNIIEFSPDFLEESQKTFLLFNNDQRVSLGDAYFGNFTVITERLISNKQYNIAFDLWTKILLFVKEWEKKNKSKKLHKGTPYYFSAVASILQNDFDAALMSMHNALLEDKLNNPQWDEAPGYFFLTLNDQRDNQYFKPFVDAMIGFIRDRLDGNGLEKGKYKKYYLKTRKGAFTYDQFRNKFLDNKNVNEQVKYFFVYSIIRIWHLRVLHKTKVGDKLMAPIIFTTALFSLLLVLDDLMKSWNNQGQSRRYISEHIYEFARNENWISSSVKKDQYLEDLDINNKFKTNFDESCKQLIGCKGKVFKTRRGRSLSPMEADFVLAYGLRNFSAHTIKSQEVLWNYYTEVLQSILNCIFKITELS